MASVSAGSIAITEVNGLGSAQARSRELKPRIFWALGVGGGVGVMVGGCAEGRAGQGGRRCTRGNIFWSPLYPLGVQKLGGSKLVLHFTTTVFLFTTYTSYR